MVISNEGEANCEVLLIVILTNVVGNIGIMIASYDLMHHHRALQASDFTCSNCKDRYLIGQHNGAITWTEAEWNEPWTMSGKCKIFHGHKLVPGFMQCNIMQHNEQ
jgi:hypothetical protein